jgi:transcriptional regulator with XRE-family HTH domain
MTTGTEIQGRLRVLGLSQVELAAMLGVTPNTIYRQFTGAVPLPGYVIAFLAAWELLTSDQRRDLRARLSEATAPISGK